MKNKVNQLCLFKTDINKNIVKQIDSINYSLPDTPKYLLKLYNLMIEEMLSMDKAWLESLKDSDCISAILIKFDKNITIDENTSFISLFNNLISEDINIKLDIRFNCDKNKNNISIDFLKLFEIFKLSLNNEIKVLISS